MIAKIFLLIHLVRYKKAGFALVKMDICIFQDKVGTLINFLKEEIALELTLDGLLTELKGVLVSTNKPLQGITVLEFSQFLSGPAAGLRLSDLGAKVIKIERPGSGEICADLFE